ncbi:MAG: condensation domain-containing protein, partial [Archangium sp.]
GHSLDSSSLRSALQQHLPEYMVPSAFLVLEALPLSPNGKLDRTALPAPDAAPSQAEHIAPRTPTEELLANLWSQLLATQTVGVTDSFFELGGHSLLATQVISRIRASFGVELPLRTLFEAPTVASLALRVDTAVRAGRGMQMPPLVPVARDGSPLPLSFAQQRLWFLDQLEPGSPLYNIPAALRLEGALDVPALRDSFAALTERHESLRTTFQVTPEGPVQRIAPQAPALLTMVDLEHLPEGTRWDEARRLAHEEAVRPFDLARGPLMRTTLLRLSERDHVLLLTMHHIVSDGWSTGVLIRELAAQYEAAVSGQPSALPALPVQYADYAAWQRGWLQGPALETQLAYWRQHLSGVPRALELPTDKPRPAVQTHRGASLPVQLPRELSEALSALARREGVTPFMVLLAAWQLLLSRYSGQDDISVGSPIAGRTQGETEGLIGFFINTLVLRTRLDGDPTFRELLARVRESALGAYAHQEVPFERLVEELKPERDLSRTPLFQVMFTLQNTPRQELLLPGLSLRGIDPDILTAKFELTLTLTDTPDGFSGTLNYKTDLFEPATIARMAEHLRALLEGIVAGPEQRLSALTLLPASERQQVLESFNASRTSFAPRRALHALIEEQAARHPEQPAVACEGQVLTYGELDARANGLAWQLREWGVGPDTCVALCLERSMDTVVALLGVWKAGGAYVPMDPSQPALRLRALVEEVAAPVVVTESRHAAAFESLPAHRVLRMDAGDGQLVRPRADAPPCEVLPDHLAYVLFTSGSTGRPKG